MTDGLGAEYYKDLAAEVNTKRRKKQRKRSKREDIGYLERFKRFLVSLILGAIAVCSMIYTAMEINSMAETANANLDSSIQVMQKHETRYERMIRSMCGCMDNRSTL